MGRTPGETRYKYPGVLFQDINESYGMPLIFPKMLGDNTYEALSIREAHSNHVSYLSAHMTDSAALTPAARTKTGPISSNWCCLTTDLRNTKVLLSGKPFQGLRAHLPGAS